MNKELFINDIPRDLANQAHAGISFTPEKRGQQEQEGYAATMASDYAELASLIADKPEMQATLDAEFARYREGYRARVIKRLHSDSRCISWMITGPSNFPVARNEKRNRVAHKRIEEQLEFRKRALAAITKTLRPELRPIMAGDSNAVESLKTKIVTAEAEQERMKAINAAHKRFLKDPASLDTSGLSDGDKRIVRNYKPEYSWEPHPIAPFELTNNSANIRRMKQRLESIGAAKATPDTQANGEHARYEDCPADNRVRLFFPGKPDAEVRSRLKSAGFRWSPTIGAWQAYRNWRSMEVAKREAGLESQVAA